MVNLQDIVALIQSKRKSNFPWKRQEPSSQPYYQYSAVRESWEEVKTPGAAASPVTRFSVLSWNIDFMLPYPNERMQVALDHAHEVMERTQGPSILFFNEMMVSDLELIQRQGWVRSGYSLTDRDDEYWESGHYGTCTLIPKSMSIKQVFRVHYEATQMERDGLFVDVDVRDGNLLRVCNTHLESLVADPPLRPQQVETSARYLTHPSVMAGIMGGDFNAIQPFDRTLHSENGLKDAYLETGGKEDSDDGYTWGQMAPVKQREMFGCSRMDKLFLAGKLEVDGFEKFGMGVVVKDANVKKALMEGEGMDGGWVTDHLGVKGDFKIPGSHGGKSPSKT